jgi:phosphoglycolate phosphatase
LPQYNTVIFDLDGTLLDTLADLTDGVNHVLSHYGYPIRSREDIRSFVGNGIRKLMERALPEHVENDAFEEMLAAFRKYYTAHCRHYTKPYEGIMEMLQRLKDRGFCLAIVSNKNDAAVKALSSYFFGDFINVVVGQQPDVPVKPAPDMVEYAITLLGAARESVIYVGDSGVDKATADHAQLDCALVTWGFWDKERLLPLLPRFLADAPDQVTSFLLASFAAS